MRRVLSALALVALVLAVSAAPVTAKGPTHMLLIAPSSGESVLMEMEDPRLFQVERLLDDVGQRVTGREWERWHEVDVAWTMQAIDIWRSDIVFVDGKGEAVVMTVRSVMEGEGYSTDWRHVNDGEALTALFDEMGLMGGGGKASTEQSGKDTSPAVTTKATAPTTPTASVEADSSSGWFSADGWGWTLPGVLAGLVLGVIGAPLLRRRAPQVVAQRFARS